VALIRQGCIQLLTRIRTNFNTSCLLIITIVSLRLNGSDVIRLLHTHVVKFPSRTGLSVKVSTAFEHQKGNKR
jgi:hypothetical protein